MSNDRRSAGQGGATGMPRPHTPPELAALAVGPAVAVQVGFEAMEATQVIQDLPGHSVPLVAGKTTVVRVYLSTTSATPIGVRGVLQARLNTPGSTWTQIPSVGTVTLKSSENGQLRLKRENLAKSLVFELPAATTAAGAWTIALSQLQRLTPTVSPLPLPAGASRVVTFLSTPPLRVRVIGIRYTDSTHGPAQTHVASANDFALIRSWLQRAYPVSTVVWSQAVVSGPLPWPFDAAQNNAFIRALRVQDVTHGADKRTHYFGLVDDAGGLNFMRGLASGVPSTPDPATVASGPTGNATFGWDTDGSYGDWYTGHELGHTFGRLHAMFCGATGGGPYPYPDGQISPNDGSFVGFDAGDPAHAIARRAVPGVPSHDVMSYCDNQWLSSFTYKGIRDRIVAEAALPAGAPAPAAGASSAGGAAGGAVVSNTSGVHVVAIVNRTKRSGSISFVNPAAAPTEAATPSEFSLRVLGSGGKVIGEYPGPFHADSCRDAGEDDTGIVDATIPASADAAALELVFQGAVLATYRAGRKPGSVKGITSQNAGAGPSLAAAGAAAAAPRPAVVRWTETGAPAAGAGLAPAGLAAAAGGVTYMVQLSTDEGKTWQTAGIGLSDPHVELDRTLFDGAKKVMIRITATDGFRSTVTDKSFNVDDL
jgi:hypothetical protein